MCFKDYDYISYDMYFQKTRMPHRKRNTGRDVVVDGISWSTRAMWTQTVIFVIGLAFYGMWDGPLTYVLRRPLQQLVRPSSAWEGVDERHVRLARAYKIKGFNSPRHNRLEPFAFIHESRLRMGYLGGNGKRYPKMRGYGGFFIFLAPIQTVLQKTFPYE